LHDIVMLDAFGSLGTYGRFPDVVDTLLTLVARAARRASIAILMSIWSSLRHTRPRVKGFGRRSSGQDFRVVDAFCRALGDVLTRHPVHAKLFRSAGPIGKPELIIVAHLDAVKTV